MLTTGVKGRSGRKKGSKNKPKPTLPKPNDPQPAPSPAPVPAPVPAPLPQVTATNSSAFTTSSPLPTASPNPEQKPETPTLSFAVGEDEEVKVEDLSDILTKAKPAEDVERERQETDKMLDGLFSTVENMWNRAGETNERGEIEAWKWTKNDSQQLKNSIMLLDAKYGFIGKSINYMPEILFAITLITIAFKGFALAKHRREGQRPKYSAPPAPANMPPVTNLTEMAEARARELGGG